MKKFLLTLAVAVCTAFSSLAATIVVDFTPSSIEGVPSTTPVNVQNKGVLFTFNSANLKGGYLMINSGGYITFSVPDKILTDFTIHTSSGASKSVNVQLSVGGTNIGNAVTLDARDADFSWTIPAANQGAGNVYKLAASNKNAQITKITFTVVDSGVTPGLSVAAPTFTPATGTKLYADDKVTIACETEGAVITYTVNGGESQAYTAEGINFSEEGPYTIKATATLTRDGKTATADAKATYTYQIVKPKAIGAVQVTSNANIIEGAEYILAHKKTDGNFVVMGATIGNNAAGTKPYINHVDKVQPNDDESITVDRTSHGIISFESDEANGRWYLAVPNAGGYIKSMLNEARGRYCKFSENPEHSATVNINNEGKAEIIFKDGDKDAYFLANPGASRFTCYESTTVGNTFTPALYALPAEDMSFSVVGPGDAEVSSNIDINGYKNEATGNYYTITVSYPKGTALYYRTTSYHMMVNGVDVLKPIVVDDKEIIPVLGEFKLAPKAEAAAAAASVAAESGKNTAVIGLASKGDFELRLQDAAGNVSEGKSYKINGNATGVEDIAVDGVEDGEAVYYNMQGVRVANPAAGSLYIRVQGSKAAKVLVK